MTTATGTTVEQAAIDEVEQVGQQIYADYRTFGDPDGFIDFIPDYLTESNAPHYAAMSPIARHRVLSLAQFPNE